ncbi:DeoR/GlpR family DNA-binding transcription regulator [Metabacillus litoralis]|uniref:DeoR/GlpR family DNA-binding transcription regulator n=1 Tax=Metabacillus litoralis TaxID=152268 RepID=UPI00203AD729|nr:DeoR/GlpR family DNA-binding transcription regulator [Metabacillus litoralis]MCM3160578.1 DeoR/GlpR family DNA-binding transcription regulator [Metabacillus litoralis]MCM3412718.1 DeoR/GlpR family DNA-binding transcription regulator [Metabacillus litoralis]
MLAVERHERILDQLDKNKIVKVSELSKLLDVTEKTIRGDLELLEKRGLLNRIHGGAVLAEDEGRMLPIAERQSGYSDVKSAIAKEAVKLIEPNETILMDGGSTTIAIAELLGEFPITVITNDLKIANVLLSKSNVQLMVLGGTRIDKSSSLMGAQATEMLKRMRVNRLFFGTTGISVEHGLTVFNSIHADWKKQIISCADHITLLADSSKFEKVALIQFAKFDEVNEIVTDTNLDPHIKETLENSHVRLHLANV